MNTWRFFGSLGREQWTEKTEKNWTKTYLAGRYILWKNIVFSVFSIFSVFFRFFQFFSVFPFFFGKKWKTEKTEKNWKNWKKHILQTDISYGKHIVFSVFFSFFFSFFFSVFPVVLVLATRCIPLAKFGWMFAVKQMSTTTEKTEKKRKKTKKPEKLKTTYLADRYILWKIIVFSVFFSVFSVIDTSIKP